MSADLASWKYTVESNTNEHSIKKKENTIWQYEKKYRRPK